jgi:predicted ATPase/DNA-binding CsgD family transcriptional regulator/tetratricopeptide (TPR) repeat protein
MTTDILLSAGNLPAEPNSFVGRERDLAELALLLTDVRALTLCGPGGIGKTRLALRLAADLAPDYPDGTWLAELADLGDPELVARRVAHTLGIREEPDRSLTETLTDALRSRHLLLILDTCEHLVDACASLVQQLLAGCRWVRVIATSREPLRVRGEQVWRVPPLELPAFLESMPAEEMLEHEAVRLFTDRAAAVRPGFTLSAENAEPVARLCRMLDGIPLAIELAAARIRALAVEQVADRLSDRFQLLASGDRTAPLRQQTLRAAVDWSYELLTPEEQALLRRLSVFSGWNLEMAEEVCADEQIPADDVLDLLAALIDKSLVSLDGEVTGDARYRLLDTIGEYAADRLAASGEREIIRTAHREYLMRLGESIVSRAFLSGDPPWRERVAMYHRIEVERANYRAALAECLERGDADRGLRLCVALRSPWVSYGDVTEGIGWFDKFLALDARVPPRVQARALVCRGELAFELQDYATAGTCARAGLELFQSSDGPREAAEAGALRLLGLVSMRAGQVDAAMASVVASVAAARAARDNWEEGLALAVRATVIARTGELAEAERAFEEALEVIRDNNGWGVAQTLYGFGTLARQRGDNAGALQHFRSALALYQEIDARPEIARCLAGIGWVAMAQLDLDLAAGSLAESLQLSLATGQRLAIARGIDAFAALAVMRDDLAAAVRLAAAGAGLRAAISQGSVRSGGSRVEALLESARQRLGSQAVSALVAEGQAMTAHEAVTFALRLRARSAAHGAGTSPPASHDVPAAGQPGPPGPAANGSPGGGAAPVSFGPGSFGADRYAAPPGTSNGPAGPAAPSVLTSRELQIADLIARGLSNRGIAAELTISPATAARHVANIFGKLGFTSRAQVAAWAAERESRRRGSAGEGMAGPGPAR